MLECILIHSGCIHQVLVNPEPKAHVGLCNQIEDSTTANVDVAVCIPILEVDTSSATNGINKQATDSGRSAIGNVDAEHKRKSKWNGASLSVAFTSTSDA